MFRLTKWNVLAPGRAQLDDRMVWNGMMTSGRWFFLAASEAISVGNKTYTLPGSARTCRRRWTRATWARSASGSRSWSSCRRVNILFWRPLVAYSEKSGSRRPKPLSSQKLRAQHPAPVQRPGYVARPLRPVVRRLDQVTRPFGLAEYPLRAPEGKRRSGDVVFVA